MRAEALDITLDTVPASTKVFHPNPAILDNLRGQIQALERGHSTNKLLAATDEPTVSLGDPKIDGALPWGGLPITGLHEIFGDTAAIGFSAALIQKLATQNSRDSDAPILWCQHGRDLCGHGLAEFGIDPDRLILVQGKSDTDILWAMEEGLRSSGIAAVIGKPYKIPPIAGRRLQLAAEENGVPGLLIRPQNSTQHQQSPTSAALTRWHVTTAPSITPASGFGLGAPKWNLQLQRYRYSALNLQKQENKKKMAGRVTSWQVEWCHETGDLSVVADLCHGSAQPSPGKAWNRKLKRKAS